MIYINKDLNAPVRTIGAKVELFEGSTLANTFNHTDIIKNFTIERVGSGKFFGFGICQKLKLHIVDNNNLINDLTTSKHLKVYFDDICNYPNFNITEVHRNEINKELSITAYDAIYKAMEHTIEEVGLVAPYNLADAAGACAEFLGLSVEIPELPFADFNLYYEEGANLEGTESIREVLDAIAEATQTIYYINRDNTLVFKRFFLDEQELPSLIIGKSSYIALDSGENRRLATIVSATELGDNYSASTSAIGSTQYVRNNPFWELREDIAYLVDKALNNMGGLTINQFNCTWRGNYALEPGDGIGLVTKDNSIVYSYLLDDVITYDGSLKEVTKWSYAENEGETASNPTNLGDVLKQTYAKVDKVNKQVDIVVSDVNTNKEQISNLQLTTSGITASVGDIHNDINSLSTRVSAAMTSEEVEIAIEQSLNDVTEVTTTTGYTFDEEGLKVTKTDAEMSTLITEDGMKVYRDSYEVLTANNTGVKAEDLHATTFLIIGDNSRLEDYGSGRTGCFWIG